VLLIGTNNTRTASGVEIATAIEKILELIWARLPETCVLLLGIFPRGPGINADGTVDDGVVRMRAIREANARLAGLADGVQVRYLDIGPRFLDQAGRIPPALMPDQLHLSPAGYRAWAEAMRLVLQEMLAIPLRTKAELR
jgi:lysophospholipase L1-like esterase